MWREIRNIMDILKAEERAKVVKENIQKRVFISHSSKDQVILDKFVNYLLLKGCNISKDSIAYTSAEQMGVPAGKKISEDLKEYIKHSDIVIFMFSDNYLQSSICLNEMGAAWILEKNILPFILVGMNKEKLPWLYRDVKCMDINSEAGLEKLKIELYKKNIVGKDFNKDDWEKNKKEFLNLEMIDREVETVGDFQVKWWNKVPLEKKEIIRGIFGNMVKVNADSFIMGATLSQITEAEEREKPMHSVKLSTYYINKYQVTQGEWIGIMGKNPSHFNNLGINHPVESVSWLDCKSFIAELKKCSGLNFNFPTEAQWEYAARGGGYDEKYSGSDDLREVGWYKSNSEETTHPVGEQKENKLGLYDMSGNVLEWCLDIYDENFYKNGCKENPVCEHGSLDCVTRGGSYLNEAQCCRVSNRYDRYSKDYRNSFIGIRLVINID